jgi:carbonic anhydrase
LPSAVQRRSYASYKGDDETEERSLWDTPDLQRIFDGNRKWQREMLARDPEFFEKAAKGQNPEFLLIGCSDSRVGAQEIMGMNQGELFVHRNIANCVVHNDMNLLSVIFYAVNVLKVHDIIVLGHYECGGVRAASCNEDLGLIEHWLRNIRDVQRLHKEELDTIEDAEKKHRRLVELNVQEQCFNLFGNSIVQQMQAKTGRPRIHGFVYDIKNGLLKHLDIDFKSQLKKYRNIYEVADFRRYEPIVIDKVIGSAEGGGDGNTNSAFTSDEEKKRQARLLFEAIDIDRKGSIGRDELKEAMDRFGLQPTKSELDEMMSPLAGLDRDIIDLDAFVIILEQIHHTIGTDRLVVIRRTGIGNEAPRPLRCRASTTVLDLKQAIETLDGTPVEHQILLHDGVRLKKDIAVLAELGITGVAELDLMIEVVPAAFKKP